MIILSGKNKNMVNELSNQIKIVFGKLEVLRKHNTKRKYYFLIKMKT